ncbi:MULTISPECIES: hypothetical protein [Microcella]|uniref:hypothetical protein n=1 Tax=Microcella TaxID=337004 RepID=UPI0015CF648A|nr:MULTISPECIES: hypothetical protein [Microcella]MBU1250933.1 hypothetical protein [Actinomycetota bacterium]MBU1608212.1 hypothetical protein [Actinomycetota bacterium]MBU2315709.1 hypothetical protein [Actinomycetota bacterium]MBU2384885.1 hypothetical protein [Actinomycetota bacterium]QOD93602.1 hypothetical protein IE160_12000 [Chryseoglobus sp. 28M-23]
MRRTAPAVGALALAVTLGLTGCFGNPLEQLTENLVEGGVENLIEDQTGVNIDVDGGGGASLPDSWPSDVPTPDGSVLFSAGVDGNFTASFEISGPEVVDQLRGDLEDSGYALTQEADYGGLLNYLYENDTYTVTAVYIAGEGENADTLQYSIVLKEQQ